MNYELTPEDIEDFGRQTELPRDSQRRFDIEPKTGIPTLGQWGAYKRQMALYFDAAIPTQDVGEWYRQPIAEETLASYAKADAEFTVEWWRRFAGEPVLINKLRGRANQTLFSLNDLIHPETVRAMTPKPPTVTSQPLYDDDWRAYGCGCVR